jgi:hypothetical protein
LLGIKLRNIFLGVYFFIKIIQVREHIPSTLLFKGQLNFEYSTLSVCGLLSGKDMRKYRKFKRQSQFCLVCFCDKKGINGITDDA